jgi:hypothetical protein
MFKFYIYGNFIEIIYNLENLDHDAIKPKIEQFKQKECFSHNKNYWD